MEKNEIWFSKLLCQCFCWGAAYTSSSVGWCQLGSWHTTGFALLDEIPWWDCVFSKENCESRYSDPPVKG